MAILIQKQYSFMHPQFIIIGAFSAAVAVALGAFGAHRLQSKVTKERMETYQTGVQYHMYHSLGLILLGILNNALTSNNYILWSGWLMIMGIILFSGSLYLLVISDKKWFGLITPFGGLAFIASWVMLAFMFM